VSEENAKPVLDEQVFAKLLEAAYVLQEHNRELQKLEVDLNLQTGRIEKDHKGQDQTGEPHASIAASATLEPLTKEIEPGSETGSAQSVAAKSTSREFSRAASSAAASSPAKSAEPVGVDALAATAAAASAEPAVRDDYTFTLAQIVETQDQIRVRHLELENAMSLVATRVTEIAEAGGAGIAFLDGKTVRYRGVAGAMTLPAGTEVPMEKALCVACLRTGAVIRCADVNPEFLVDADECRRRGIQAMIAVPIYHDGGIAGGLELYYANLQAFTEQDVHTCQLMAGLITEALAREDEVSLKKSMASERALMLEALERLKPNLAALADTAAGRGTPASGIGLAPQASSGHSAAGQSAAFVCRKCGHQLMGDEQFCGKCGSPRSRDYQAPSMQSKVASLWHMQEATKNAPAPPNGNLGPGQPLTISAAAGAEKPLADSIEEEMPEFFAAPELRVGKMPQPAPFLEDLAAESIEPGGKPEITIPLEIAQERITHEEAAQEIENEEESSHAAAEIALAKPVHAANWSSAISAREFLEQLAGARRPGAFARFWKTRRGDVYLAVAVVLVAVVIRWGIWSNHSVSATGGPATTAAASHRKPAADADLSLFDRMLISLGLAEAPPPPESRGNPDTQVWIDLHTALYYCPGADLYGKTPKGRFDTQHEAQLDQFEPAYRKPCE
jgi:putative methionine-R-sulfoxide reductase with GAF domain